MNHRTSPLIFLLVCLTFFQSSMMQVKSFGLDLIHRDSPGSPFYNKSISQSEMLIKDAHRSHAQVNIVRNSSSSTYSNKAMVYTMESSGDNYLGHYVLGSTRFVVSAFISLRTAFTWTKCKSNNQEEGEKVYEWDKSKSHERLKWSDPRCHLFSFTEKDPNSEYCTYRCATDKDKREPLYTSGVIAMDENYFFSWAEDVLKHGDIIMGCSYINEGFPSEVQGVLGLGRGPGSWVYMMRAETKNKFNYCLRERTTEHKPSNQLRFGDTKPIIKSKMTSVPLQKVGWKTLDLTFQYYLSLEGVTIGDKYIEKTIPDQLIRIDLGMSLTYFPTSIYNQIEDKVTKMFPEYTNLLPDYKICFDNGEENRKQLPKMKLHFSDTIYYELAPSNVFDEIDDKFCLAISEFGNTFAFIGSKAQENHYIEFDNHEDQLSFTPPEPCYLFD